MGSDLATQHRVGVEETPRLARAARDAGVARFVHLSTCAVYGPPPGARRHRRVLGPGRRRRGRLRGDQARHRRRDRRGRRDHPGAGPAAGHPRRRRHLGVEHAPPARRSATTRQARHDVPRRTFRWVHVDDLAALVADVAAGRIATADDPAEGPVAGGCTVVDVAGEPATARDYLGHRHPARSASSPSGRTARPGRARSVTDRARGWGWTPRVSLADALAELEEGVRALGPPDATAGKIRPHRPGRIFPRPGQRTGDTTSAGARTIRRRAVASTPAARPTTSQASSSAGRPHRHRPRRSRPPACPAAPGSAAAAA